MNNQWQNDANAIVKRDKGRFAEGNKEGKRFEKGSPGKPKGARNKKSILARQFADDVLSLDPETGKKMTYKELLLYIKRKADKSPRILNLLLDHWLGKPVEQVQQEQRIIIMPPLPEREVEVVTEEQDALPEGEE
jgi:hypothetical protein